MAAGLPASQRHTRDCQPLSAPATPLPSPRRHNARCEDHGRFTRVLAGGSSTRAAYGERDCPLAHAQQEPAHSGSCQRVEQIPAPVLAYHRLTRSDANGAVDRSPSAPSRHRRDQHFRFKAWRSFQPVCQRGRSAPMKTERPHLVSCLSTRNPRLRSYMQASGPIEIKATVECLGLHRAQVGRSVQVERKSQPGLALGGGDASCNTNIRPNKESDAAASGSGEGKGAHLLFKGKGIRGKDSGRRPRCLVVHGEADR